MAKNPTTRGRPREENITESQRRALREIRGFISRTKYPPTMAELGESLGVSAASAHQLVKQLERKGYISIEPLKSRSLKILREHKPQIESLVTVPLIGVVKAGPAMLAEENRLGEVLIEKRTVGSGRCFALQVKGDSMIGAGMSEGDLVICRQQPVAESGDVVVVLLDGEATVKRLAINGDRIELRPENTDYKPISISPEMDFRILGKVIAIKHFS